MALIKCEDCGAEYSDKVERCPKCGCPIPKKGKTIQWSYVRLTMGILSFFYAAFMLFIAFIGGVVSLFVGSNSSEKLFVISILFIIAGVWACVTHKSRDPIITIIPGGLYWLATIILLINFTSWHVVIPFLVGLVFVIDGRHVLKAAIEKIKPAIDKWKAKNKKEA